MGTVFFAIGFPIGLRLREQIELCSVLEVRDFIAVAIIQFLTLVWKVKITERTRGERKTECDRSNQGRRIRGDII